MPYFLQCGIFDTLNPLFSTLKEFVKLDSERAMVSYAKALLDEGYHVELGRTGVAELTRISDIFISDESGMIVITPSGATSKNRILMAPDQLAVVNAVHDSGSEQA